MATANWKIAARREMDRRYRTNPDTAEVTAECRKKFPVMHRTVWVAARLPVK